MKHVNLQSSHLSCCSHKLLHEQVVYREEEAIKLEKANKAFVNQKYKQHHHPVHVAHSTYIKTAYLDALPINNEEEEHDAWPERYLDTLNYNAKRSTWDVYKDKLEEVKPVSEADGTYLLHLYQITFVYG